MSIGNQPVDQYAGNIERRKASLFIPGFVAGFVVVAVLALITSLIAIGVDANSISQLRGNQSNVWSPPPIPTTDSAQNALDGQNEDSDTALQSSQVVRSNITSSLVNIRSTPGYLGKPSSDITGQLLPGEEIVILNGPREADGLTWWFARTDAQADALEGWIAEATGSGVQILGE